MQNKLDDLIKSNFNIIKNGSLANYIPELGRANKEDVGFYLIDAEGNEIKFGAWDKRFTMQSVSKVVSLIFALEFIGEELVFSRIGMEQTSDAFNSIIKLETTGTGKPLNPLINAGAIATISLIMDTYKDDTFDELLKFVRLISDDEDIEFNKDVYTSEKTTGDINRSLAYFQKGRGNIKNEVEDVLSSYFKMCSLNVNCKTLGIIGMVLAFDGINPFNNQRYFSKKTAKITKAIMTTCGLYDTSGKFAVKVGLPAKSGVGGGIMACSPKKAGIGTFGPSLDSHGNSIAGSLMLELASNELDLNIF